MSALPPKADIAEHRFACSLSATCEHNPFLNCRPSFAHRLRRAVPKNLGSGAGTGITEVEIRTFPKNRKVCA